MKKPRTPQVAQFPVRISRSELSDALEQELETKPSEVQLHAFVGHVLIDVPQWLHDNARSWNSN